MHIHDFFLELREAAYALPEVEHPPGEPPSITEKELLIGRLNYLLQMVINPPDKRYRDQMLRAWRMVVVFGKPAGLFRSYEGDNELRETLGRFLSEL